MGHWLWCAVHLIEVFGLFWCLMVYHIPIVEFHTSKSSFNMHLYIKVLFSRESLDFHPKSHDICRTFKLSCWRFVLMVSEEIRHDDA
jgi:hypothetical protein